MHRRPRRDGRNPGLCTGPGIERSMLDASPGLTVVVPKATAFIDQQVVVTARLVVTRAYDRAVGDSVRRRRSVRHRLGDASLALNKARSGGDRRVEQFDVDPATKIELRVVIWAQPFRS